jgi:hypothetical protein
MGFLKGGYRPLFPVKPTLCRQYVDLTNGVGSELDLDIDTILLC